MVYFSGEREISFHLAKAAYKNDGENNCAETSLVFDLYRAGGKNAENSCESCDQENKNFTWKNFNWHVEAIQNMTTTRPTIFAKQANLHEIRVSRMGRDPTHPPPAGPSAAPPGPGSG